MSPATPSTSDYAADVRSTSSASTFGNASLHSALSSKIEPSPASTYGSSAASDSGVDDPQTPDNEGAILTGLARLVVSDENKVDVDTQSSGTYSIDLSKSNRKGYSPGTERYSPPFVRSGTQNRIEDPFQSPSKNASKYRTSAQRTPKGPRQSGRSSNDWRSKSSDGSDRSPTHPKATPSADAAYGSTQRKLSFHVQEHVSESSDEAGNRLNAYTVVKAEDAQAVYPPSCCVFVANLLQSENEDSLQMAVTQVFREFGPVFVKIRRDGKHMPFAFCQYTKQEHAEKAIRDGRGRMIKGRPCRCEKAKAHRLFFVERKYGSVITPDEVRELLEQFGNIELCYTASHVERTALNLNEGVIVQFEMYDEGQDAQSAFRNHELYKMQPIAGLAAPAQQAQSPPEMDSTKAYLARYEVDRRSIFVGNLPLGVTEQQLRNLFEHYGDIQEISLRENVSKYDSDEKFAFAFIEFRSPLAVANAVSAKNGFTFAGRSLRVAQKDSENGGSRGRSSRSQPSTSTSARSFQSPVARQFDTQQQPTSPSSQMSPASYASPYSYNTYGYAASPYGYTGTAVFTDGQGHYFSNATPYSPAPAAYYPYQTSPSYDVGSPAPTAEMSGSPTAPSPYYAAAYSPYQYAPAPYWGVQSPTAGNQSSVHQAYYHGSAYSPVGVGGKVYDETRSTTPTPSGHAPAVERPMDSQ